MVEGDYITFYIPPSGERPVYQPTTSLGDITVNRTCVYYRDIITWEYGNPKETGTGLYR